MTKLINPLQADAIMNTIAKRAISTAGFKEVANKNAIDDVSKCVECGIQMRIMDCNDIPCFVCLDHRVALPCKDA